MLLVWIWWIRKGVLIFILVILFRFFNLICEVWFKTCSWMCNFILVWLLFCLILFWTWWSLILGLLGIWSRVWAFNFILVVWWIWFINRREFILWSLHWKLTTWLRWPIFLSSFKLIQEILLLLLQGKRFFFYHFTWWNHLCCRIAWCISLGIRIFQLIALK